MYALRSHSDHLIQFKPAKLYGLQSIRLLGIGEKINYLKEVGVLPVKKDDDGVCFMLCYVFDAPVGDINKVILLGLHTMMKANINIFKHMKDSLEDKCTPLAFWPYGMSFDEAVKGLTGSTIMEEHHHGRSIHDRDSTKKDSRQDKSRRR
jgi:hypothetical protein